MKQITTRFIVALLVIISQSVHAQTIDLSTGINNSTGMLIPLYTDDDTWTVKLPGSTTYQPVKCGSAILDGVGVAYAGSDPSVRWLSPYLNTAGQHLSTALVGDYYYKMNFRREGCNVQSAVINFAHIGADNEVQEISVNGNVHAVSYTFNPFVNNVTIPLAASEIIANGNNEIIIKVNNLSTWTGIEIKGNLTIQSSTTLPDAAFSVTSTHNANGSLSIQGNSALTDAEHTWSVYATETGSGGPYTLINTFNTQNFSLTVTGKCFYIKHKVKTACGEACAAQSVCNLPCVETSCSVTTPVNLAYNKSIKKLMWNAVPNATSYKVEIVINDSNCCRGERNALPVVKQLTVTNNFCTVNPTEGVSTKVACYSFKVKAICSATTSSSFSAPLCIFDSVPNSTGVIANYNAENTTVKIFPNPSKSMVSIDIETNKDMEYTISIYDVTGRAVKTFEKMKTSDQKASVKWNTESLARGEYFVRIVTSDNQVITKKLVKE